MQEQPDAQLLRAHVQGDDAAFREIVSRHTDFVYSAALRQVNSPALAQDIAQDVFVDLVRKSSEVSARMADDASLAGWLYRSTRFAVLNHMRDEHRRVEHERQAMEQLITDSSPAADWERIRPVLDEAMAELSDADRDALLLRFFKNHDFQTVGRALGLSADAAQKRVTRAVDRLRKFFAKRGVAVSAGGLAVLIPANAVQAAPPALSTAISTAAILTGTTAAHTSTAIAATKVIAMTALQKTIVTATFAVVAATGIYEAHQAARLRKDNQTLQQQQAALTGKVKQLQQQREDAANQLADLIAENSRQNSNTDNSELLKLRAEVARLNQEANDPALSSARAAAQKVAKLKQRLEEKPAWKIPELQFISDKDWTEAAWDIDLSTDDGMRDALSRVRETAINRFLNEMMKVALKKYLAAHGNSLPDSLNQIESYFDVPVTDDMLARYKLLQSGQVDDHAPLVRLATNVDDLYDSNHTMSINGASGGRFNGARDSVEAAVMSYAVDHQGQMPSNPSQISGYLQTPLEDVTIQKYLTQALADPLPPEKLVLLPAVKAYTKANHGKMPDNATDLLPYITTDVQKVAIQKLSK